MALDPTLDAVNPHGVNPHEATTPEHPAVREDVDRRVGRERRSRPRRLDELRAFHQSRNFGRIATLCAASAAAIAVWALVNAPVTRSATACTDTLGAELLHHREIHPLWIVAMLLSAIAVALPSRPRRSYVSVGLVGLTIGLGVAAYIRVATWKTGICFV